MSEKENLRDSEKQMCENRKNIWYKVNFYSVISAVACFLIGIVELSLMNFFTDGFTVVFLSVMGSLTFISGIIWIVSNRIINGSEKRKRQGVEEELADGNGKDDDTEI